MPRAIPRWLARAPVGLFGRGWGRLFGGRLLMLEHTGRRSGLPRRVVLEVVGREPAALFVVSGDGGRSQWLRNVRIHPAVRIWTDRLEGVQAVANVLGPVETRQRLDRYRAEHRLAARVLGRALGIPDLVRQEAMPVDVWRRLPIVRVDLSGRALRQ